VLKSAPHSTAQPNQHRDNVMVSTHWLMSINLARVSINPSTGIGLKEILSFDRSQQASKGWTRKQNRTSAYIKRLQVQERAALLMQTAPGCAGRWILQAEKMRSEADISRRREITKLRQLSVLLGLDNRTEMTNSKHESLNC